RDSSDRIEASEAKCLDQEACMITDQAFDAFFLGAALGSIVTYLYLTREKRLIARIRRDISLLGHYHELDKAQYRKIITDRATEELANEQQVLAVCEWSLLATKDEPLQHLQNVGPERLAAETIICEELLGLTRADAIHALTASKTLDDLSKLRAKTLN